jgi:hypothetical protein
VFWTNALRGFGFGLGFAPMTILACRQPAGWPDYRGLRRLHAHAECGSSLFISLAIVLLERSTTTNPSRTLEFINPFNGIVKGPAAP